MMMMIMMMMMMMTTTTMMMMMMMMTTTTTTIMAGDITLKCVGRKEFYFLSTHCAECIGNLGADLSCFRRVHIVAISGC